MEKVVNCRIIHFLESEGQLSPNQCGFRKNKSTSHVLAQLEHDICTAHEKKSKVIGVLLDKKQAYVLTNHKTVSTKLHMKGIDGKCWVWVGDFMAPRKIRVKVLNTLSEVFVVRRGLPQGSHNLQHSS